MPVWLVVVAIPDDGLISFTHKHAIWTLEDIKPLALARAMAKTGSLGSPGIGCTQKLGGAKQEVRLRRQS